MSVFIALEITSKMNERVFGERDEAIYDAEMREVPSRLENGSIQVFFNRPMSIETGNIYFVSRIFIHEKEVL